MPRTAEPSSPQAWVTPANSPNQSVTGAIAQCPQCPDEPSPEWKAAATAVFPGKQSYQNCGLQSGRQIIEQARGICLGESELEFMEKAINAGMGLFHFEIGTIRIGYVASRGDPHPDESGGTNADQRRELLSQYTVSSSIVETSEAALTTALRSKKGIVASVSAGVLWSDATVSGNHAIVVTYGKFDSNCKLVGVYINDTGTGQHDRYLTISDFMAAADAHPASRLNITDLPIWP